jgi:hypothetical protein
MSDELSTSAKLATHEAVCAERYSGISKTLGRHEGYFKFIIGGTVVQLLAAMGYVLSLAMSKVLG